MNWEAIAAIGEIVGAIAVVGSLVFVGWQMAQNTDALRTSTSQSHAELYMSISTRISESREMATLYITGLSDLTELDEADRVRFIAFVSSTFRFYETSFVQHRKGKLDEELWFVLERQIKDLVTAEGIRSWWAIRRHWHSAEFRALIESLITSDGGKSMYGRDVG